MKIIKYILIFSIFCFYNTAYSYVSPNYIKSEELISNNSIKVIQSTKSNRYYLIAVYYKNSYYNFLIYDKKEKTCISFDILTDEIIDNKKINYILNRMF